MIDNTALFKFEYGLYLVTTKDEKDNGMIINSATQLTDSPLQVGVTINKSTYSHDIIIKTKKLNLCPLTQSAPFSLFENFGFKSGKDHDKFEGVEFQRSENGLAVITNHINSYLSLEVTSTVDLGTHTLFICTVTEAKVINDSKTMTYAYYHTYTKPKPQSSTKAKGYVCTICGYVYEGDPLPPDYVCPLCNHGAQFFEKLED